MISTQASGGAFGADDGDVLPREVGLLATASMDRTIKLWELPAMVCVSTLEGHSAGVRSLSYDTVVQFEDFESSKAQPILDKYRHTRRCFNDDIQGTGPSVLWQ